jgi:hypothetical protein
VRKVVRGRYERKTLQDEALCRLRLKSRSYVQDTRREPAGTRTGENRVKGTVEGGGRERGCRAILHRTAGYCEVGDYRTGLPSRRTALAVICRRTREEALNSSWQ